MRLPLKSYTMPPALSAALTLPRTVRFRSWEPLFI